ncbi:MAG: hypothetical protein R3A10_08730 [Caldilineaceae bacterium]
MVVASLALGVLLVAGCGNMRVQPKLAKPFMESPEFGVAARDILPEAVAVGQLNEDELFYNGTIDGELADVFPFPVTADVIARGQSKFNAFCTPCHGYGGYGDGVIYEEGFPTPASYHDPVIREKPVGLLPGHQLRLQQHVQLRQSGAARGSLGHRRLHPYASAQPKRAVGPVTARRSRASWL